jgi:GNAT superfamily N-acetyltransferase
MQIRRLTEADREQMRPLLYEFSIDFNRDQLFQGGIKEVEALKDEQGLLNSELESFFNKIAFVAEDQGQILGYIVGEIKYKEYRVLDKQGSIDEFFVTASARGKGAGTQLLEELVEEFKSQGCNVLRVSAYALNTKTLDFYRKFGFFDTAIVLNKKL